MTTAPSPRLARHVAVGIAALLALATPIVLAVAAPGEDADDKQVRAGLSTARYNNVDQAVADGFTRPMSVPPSPVWAAWGTTT